MNTYFQNQLRRIGQTLVVMGGSFFLYYLGLFGNVDGPLSPDRIGLYLAGAGITKIQVKLFLLALLVLSLTWNYPINLINRIREKDSTGHSPLKKGAFAHGLWICILIFNLLIWFLEYNGH